jgi:hypothetical protein
MYVSCKSSDELDEGADVQQESSVIPSDGLWGNVRVRDVMDTVGGKLCYVYA